MTLPAYRYILLLLIFVLAFNVSYSQQTSKADSLKSVLAQHKEDTAYISVLNELVDIMQGCRDSTQWYYIDKYRAVARRFNDKRAILSAQLYSADYYNTCLANADKAIAAYDTCYRQATVWGYNVIAAKALNNIAFIYYNQGSYVRALDYYRRCMETDSSVRQKISVFANVASIYVKIGDYANAVDYYVRAYNMHSRSLITAGHASEMDTIVLISMLNNIAIAYVAMSDYDKALENYRHMQELNKHIQYSLLNVYSLRGIGKCLLMKKDYTAAINSYKEALALNVKKGLDTREVLVELGNIYLEMGDINEAAAYAAKVADISSKFTDEESSNDNYSIPGCAILTGKIAMARKQYNNAIANFQKAIAIYKRAGMLDDESKVWMELSMAYELMGRSQDAFNAYRQYIGLRDSVFSQEKAKQITRTEMQGEFDRKQFSDSLKNEDVKKQAAFKLQRQRMFTYSGIGAVLILAMFSFFIFRERKKSDKLLLNILPKAVAAELKSKGVADARHFDNVTVLFTDFVGFTNVSERLTATELVNELDACFREFDRIMAKYNIEKIKTVGDAYLAVAGLPLPDENHAMNVVRAAIEIKDFMLARRKQLGDNTFRMRIGVHSGSLVAGIVGLSKFAYDIWGDTVNTAARMEQHGTPGRVNVSETTYQLIKDEFICTYRGELEAKNKGMLKMYFVDG